MSLSTIIWQGTRTCFGELTCNVVRPAAAPSLQAQKPGLFRRFWSAHGPGMITGAADDDPSGIATYSLAGA